MGEWMNMGSRRWCCRGPEGVGGLQVGWRARACERAKPAGDLRRRPSMKEEMPQLHVERCECLRLSG